MKIRKRVYTDQEAELYGRRRFCYANGHDLETAVPRYVGADYYGGPQMQYDREPNDAPAACDAIKCNNCDAQIVVVYPEIGTVVEG